MKNLIWKKLRKSEKEYDYCGTNTEELEPMCRYLEDGYFEKIKTNADGETFLFTLMYDQSVSNNYGWVETQIYWDIASVP